MFVAAAVQVAPRPGPLTAEVVAANSAHAVDWVQRCVEATGAELVVLPESVTTGFTPGIAADHLWELVSAIPGPVTEPFQDCARDLGIHLCVGTYERGPTPDVVYNAAVLIGPDGAVLGVYRKTHPFVLEDVAVHVTQSRDHDRELDAPDPGRDLVDLVAGRQSLLTFDHHAGSGPAPGTKTRSRQ